MMYPCGALHHQAQRRLSGRQKPLRSVKVDGAMDLTQGDNQTHGHGSHCHRVHACREFCSEGDWSIQSD